MIYKYKAREAVDERLEKEAEALGKAAARKHMAEGKVAKEARTPASGSQNQ